MVVDKFVVPGRQYIDSVRQLTGELLNTIRDNPVGKEAGYPIGRVFDILPLNPLDGTAAPPKVWLSVVMLFPLQATPPPAASLIVVIGLNWSSEMPILAL